MNCQSIINKRKELWANNPNIEADKEYLEVCLDYILKPDNEAIRQEIQDNPEYLIQMFFYIVDKYGVQMPFFYNDVQQEFVNILKKAIQEYKDGQRNHLKFIVLKGRQQGFTSLITAIQLAYTIVKKNFAGYTLADKNENATAIFEKKAKYPLKLLPEKLKPKEKYNNKKELQFEDLNSSWGVGSAENGETGRGSTLGFFHGSEVAFWKCLIDIFAAIGNALTNKSIQILETTANGCNEFKELWDEATAGKNNYEALFFEWWRTPEYNLKFESKEKEHSFVDKIRNDQSDLSKTLRWLQSEKELNWGQLYWYYNKALEQKNKMPQEYPNTPEEAFLHSGRPYFNIQSIKEALQRPDKRVVESKRQGLIKIYEKPVPGKFYFVGADVAEGLIEGDYSHAKFFRWDTLEEVCQIHCKLPPDEFGDLLTEYGLFYNKAFLGVECNNHGLTTLTAIHKTNNYKNIYFSHSQDKTTDDQTTRMGWYTSSRTKPLMLDELDSAVVNKELTINDKETLHEMMTVVYDEKDNVSINSKDRVAATAIANQMRKYYKPVTAGSKGKVFKL